VLFDLHSHLEGRVRATTAAALAPLAGLSSPDGGWDSVLRLAGPGDLTALLAVVSSTYPFFGRPDWVARIVREAVEDSAAQGLGYLELRFGPVAHVAEQQSLDDVIAAACEGLSDGCAASGLAAGLVISALRKHDAGTNAGLARTAARFAGRGVVGFDLAGNERRFPDLQPHTEAFEIARAAGLGLTAHAAEAAPGTAARAAAELFGVTRIGHGTHIASDPEILRWAADSGIVIEVCPTSNWFTGAIAAIADHPAPMFRDAGVRLVLGDDNPVQTGSALPAERAVLSDVLGFSDEDLISLDQTSLEAAFLSPAQRASLSRTG
jgi:adenosine deaminase